MFLRLCDQEALEEGGMLYGRNVFVFGIAERKMFLLLVLIFVASSFLLCLRNLSGTCLTFSVFCIYSSVLPPQR